MPAPVMAEEPKEITPDASFFDTLEAVETPEPAAIEPEIPTTPAIVEASMVLQQEQLIEESAAIVPESLNDRLRTEHETLADNIKKQTTGSITQNIALHQKFMFIQQLYHGSSANYDESIKKLEQASSYQETMDLIKYTFAKQYSWDMTGEAAIALIELVKRKFGV
jgi:hypothetical protein